MRQDWPSHKKDCARLKIEAAQQAEVEAGVKAKQSLAERNNVPRITSDGAVFMDKKTGDVVCSLEQFRAKMLLKVMMMKEGDVEDPLNTPGFGPATGVPHKEEMRLIRAKFKKQQAKDPARTCGSHRKQYVIDMGPSSSRENGAVRRRSNRIV